MTELLDPGLTDRWTARFNLGAITPRRLLSHTAGLPDYFRDAGFRAAVAADPRREWAPADLAARALDRGTPLFEPGAGFAYSDTGYVLAGLLVEAATGESLADVYRRLILDPLGMDSTWLEGAGRPRSDRIAHHYADGVDMSSVSPSIDWAGGGLVTTAADLTRFFGALRAGVVIDSHALEQLRAWTEGASFPPGHAVRYDRYGLGLGSIELGGAELVGHTGFYGAFGFFDADSGVAMAGTHNDADVSRWPLVEALVRFARARTLPDGGGAAS